MRMRRGVVGGEVADMVAQLRRVVWAVVRRVRLVGWKDFREVGLNRRGDGMEVRGVWRNGVVV
jgi:hypothetical protein